MGLQSYVVQIARGFGLHYVLIPLVCRRLVDRFYPIPDARGTPEHQKKYARALRVTRALFYLSYALYKIFGVVYDLKWGGRRNFYAVMGIPRHIFLLNDDHASAKGMWRKLARTYHPDKIGQDGEAFFVQLRTAYETVSNPLHQFAYDSFGPLMLEWPKARTLWDFVSEGAYDTLMFHLFSFLPNFIFMVFVDDPRVRWWRLLTILSAFTLELWLRVDGSLAQSLPGNFLPFERVLLLRESAQFLVLFEQMVVPLFLPPVISDRELHQMHSAIMDRVSAVHDINKVRAQHGAALTQRLYSIATSRFQALSNSVDPSSNAPDSKTVVLDRLAKSIVLNHNIEYLHRNEKKSA